jgi:16S rRNA (guanine966-N2)-methyltransferase
MSAAGKVRIVSGAAGGLWIRVPKNFSSRPTQDRVKQAIFSTLGALVHGAAVADLYAGSGSLGLEALSRGAASCVFVEKDRHYAKAIGENLAWTKLEGGTVVARDAFAFCESAPAAGFDLLFLDPPYLKKAASLAADPVVPRLARMLRPGGTVVWEHDSLNTWDGLQALAVQRSVRYGETTVSYLGLP